MRVHQDRRTSYAQLHSQTQPRAVDRQAAAYLLDGAHVYFVVHIQAADVAPVALNDVDEVVHVRILPKQHLRVVQLVLLRSRQASNK